MLTATDRQSFHRASYAIHRLCRDVKDFSGPHRDLLALEDALRLENRQARISLETTPRPVVLVGPRGCGKWEAVEHGMQLANWNREDPAIKACSFGEFMFDSKKRLLEYRRDRRLPLRDPVPYLVAQLCREKKSGGDGLRLLVLNDVQVTAMDDAMVLRRLFLGLFGFGVGVVFVTTRPPNAWYAHGVNKDKLASFTGMLEKHAEFVRMDTIYRKTPVA